MRELFLPFSSVSWDNLVFELGFFFILSFTQGKMRYVSTIRYQWPSGVHLRNSDTASLVRHPVRTGHLVELRLRHRTVYFHCCGENTRNIAFYDNVSKDFDRVRMDAGRRESCFSNRRWHFGSNISSTLHRRSKKCGTELGRCLRSSTARQHHSKYSTGPFPSISSNTPFKKKRRMNVNTWRDWNLKEKRLTRILKMERI